MGQGREEVERTAEEKAPNFTASTRQKSSERSRRGSGGAAEQTAGVLLVRSLR